MNTLLEHPLVVRLGWTLLHFIWQGAAVAVILAILLQLARTAKPTVRYGFACAALVLMAICPIVTFCISAPAETNGSAPRMAPINLSAMPAALSAELPEQIDLQSDAPRAARANTAPSSVTTIAPATSAATTHGLWQPAFVAIWLAGVVLLSARHFLGLMGLRSLRRSAEPITDSRLQQVLARLKEQLGIRGAVELLASAQLHTPAVIGVLRPAILFPFSALTGLSVQQLTAVLSHELAHVRRWDFPVNILQSLIETVLFYHPAVWWVSHVARREREFCADDVAIAVGNDRVCYAKALTRLAELDTATLAVAATGGSLLSRITRIVGRPEPRRGGAFTMVAGLVTASVFAAALLTTRSIAQEPPVIDVKVGESIQAAIDSAAEGTQIRLAEGEYKERIRIAKKVTLQGAGWDKTRILQPVDNPKKRKEFEDRIQAAKNPEERNALIESSRAALDGPTLSIRGAKGVQVKGLRLMGINKGEPNSPIPPVVVILQSEAKLTDSAVTGPADDGIHILDGSQVEIANCLIAGFGSEGITIRGAAGADPKVVMHDSELRNVYHYGMSIGRGCDRVTIQRCRISGTLWHGIRYDNASPLIEGNTFYAHARSGIYASGRTRATIRGNVFYANAMSGVSCWFNNEDLIEQNTFVSNTREAVAVLGSSKPTIRSNIFYANNTAIDQGAISNDPTNAKGSAILENNVFWKNEKNLPVDKKDELPADSRSILEDPKFADANKGDYNLTAESPAAKAGAGAREPISTTSPWPIVEEEKKHMPNAAARVTSNKGGASSRPAADIYQKRAQLYPSVEGVVKDALQIDDADKRKAAIDKIRAMVASKDDAEAARGLVAHASIGPVKYDKSTFREPLLAKLASEDTFIRAQAVSALSGGAGTRDDLGRITELARDDDANVRGAVAAAIVLLTKKDLTGPEGAKWVEMFEATNGESRRSMIQTLWGVKTTAALQDRLVNISREDRGLGYDTLYYALSTSPNKQAACVTRLIEYLAAEDTTNVAGRAAWGLGYGVEPSEQSRVADAMIKVYNARDDGYMRSNALSALPNYARAEHVAELEKIVAKPGLAEDDKKKLEGIIAVAKQKK